MSPTASVIGAMQHEASLSTPQAALENAELYKSLVTYPGKDWTSAHCHSGGGRRKANVKRMLR